MNDSRDQFNPFAHNLSSSNPLRGDLLQEFDRPKTKPDFSMLENLIKLPALVKLKPESSPFKKPGNELMEASFISSQLKKNIIEQRELLINEFQAFEPSENFQFYFPESKFPPPPEGKQNKISYQKPFLTQNQNTYRDKLSSQQIGQIRETGQFSVKSSREWVKIPYIWKMNETLFKGIKNVQRDWNRRLGTIVGVFEDTWEMLTVDLPEELAHIGKFPWRIINLVFGKKQMLESHIVNYNLEVAKDFWHEVMTKHYLVSKEWGSDLWNFLDTQFRASIYEQIPFNSDFQEYKKLKKQKSDQLAAFDARKKASKQKVDKLINLSGNFSGHWDKVAKKVFSEISNSVQVKYLDKKNKEPSKYQSEEREKVCKNTPEETEILEKFQEEQFTYYLNFLKKQFTANQVPINVIEAIVTLLTLMHATKKKEKVWRQKQESRKTEIQKNVKNQNPIRSRNFTWFCRRVQKIFQPIENQLRQEFLKSFLDQEIHSRLNQKQIKVLNLWVQYTRTYNNRIQEKQAQKQTLYSPFKTFTLSYMLLPPYDVIRHTPSPTFDHTYYTMPRQREIQVTTAYCGWKFILYCQRLRVWAINAFVTLVYMCWAGPLGLRCLCGVDKFAYDQYVNQESGVVTDVTRKTVLGHFATVLEGIGKSRDTFEAQPDTGIFGKNCSRICNLLECYVFRFFVVGVLVLLTLYPIAIIFCSIVSFFLLITIWVWMPLVIIGTFLFSLLIYNVDNINKYSSCYYNLFPLIVLIFRFIFSILKVIFYFSAFFIFTPLFSLFIVVYACICRCLRSFTDCLVLGFLGCCGHVPSTDSMFATKISGADMATRFFMSINEEDVYYLIQAQLEQIHLKEIEKLTNEKLQVPLQKYKKIMGLIVQPLVQCQKSPYGSSSDSYLFGNISTNPINTSVQKVRQLCTQKYTEHFKRYPQRPSNVRFTQEQLNLFFDNTLSIVKTYVNKHKLNKWIFARFDLQEGDFAELTRKVWIDVFQCGEKIFEPLQSIDERFKLEDQYQDSQMYNYNALRVDVSKVVNAIKGQNDLKNKKVAVINPINTVLFTKKYQIVKVYQLLNMAQANSQQNVLFYQQSPIFIFAPHLSIKELIKYDDAHYAKLREQNRKQSEKC